jgi:hypothetical protein
MENFLKEPKEVKFQKFHDLNPKVYELYKKFALQLINAGRKRIGSKMIIERIRWETSINTKGEEYKINNDYTCFYSRMFTIEFPQHKDKFQFRELRSY